MIDYSPKNIRMWSMLGESGTAGYVLNELAKDNLNLAVLTSDLCFYSGLERFRTNYPNQFYNVGIAEQNMVAVGAGMSKEGMNVFANTYATFAACRALDQVRVNMGYMQLPVKLIGLAAGLSGGILGATHMSCEDLAIMRSIPNLTVISPADCTETAKVIECVERLDKPVYIRLTSGQRIPTIYKNDYEYVIGKAIKLQEGNKVLIVATGSMVNTALVASRRLSDNGISCCVVDMHTIKPLDTSLLYNSLNFELIVTIEEHSIIGGLGSAIAELLSEVPNHPPIYKIGINDFYPHAASYEHLLMQCNLTSEQLIQLIAKKYKEI